MYKCSSIQCSCYGDMLFLPKACPWIARMYQLAKNTPVNFENVVDVIFNRVSSFDNDLLQPFCPICLDNIHILRV